MRLCVIPARGGSKRIPRKNIRDFCGQPMIAWSIQAARESACFDKIIVTTDDEEIAAQARLLGASTPFMRPPELADDYATTLPVIRHAVQWQVSHGAAPTHVCCLYATAPFVRPQDLRQGLARLCDTGSCYAFTVTSYPFPVQRALRITPAGSIEMLHPEHANTRSQDLEEAFHDAGQFYWGTAAAWLDGVPIYGPASVPVVLPRWRVQDIDTAEDWQRAELMFNAMRQLPD